MSIEKIKEQLKEIPKCSGIYQFLDINEKVLYVGKAKNLYKRIASYTNKNNLSLRILRMITLAQKVEITRTATEIEALLLEHNLIKKISPPYNILLKDDKTFPQILITNHKYPLITKYRGVKNNNGNYFGPFANAFEVNKTIDILRKSFLLRNCSDSEFKNRKKPCLEYQIKKCSAPCVGMISENEYSALVKNALQVLNGKSDFVQKKLQEKMKNLSENMEYEKALIIRDQIKALNYIQIKQNINVGEVKNFDAITAVSINNKACIYISFYRSGQNYGAKPYYFDIDDKEKLKKLLNQFIGQFYLSQTPPNFILVNLEIDEKKLMNDFLSKIINKKVEILYPKKGEKNFLIKEQEKIALQNLEQKISHNMSNKKILLEIKNVFGLSKIPQRIEVYDNSHLAGTNAVGAMITAGVDGFIKSGYRKFNIREQIDSDKINIPKDDTAMLHQVLLRRFSKLKSEDFPDLIIIDGGKGQLSTAHKIFTDLKIKIPLICMSKGKKRNAGEEYFHQINKESFTLEKNSPVMHYLQRLRDEAHRFAIMTHRVRRKNNIIS